MSETTDTRPTGDSQPFPQQQSISGENISDYNKQRGLYGGNIGDKRGGTRFLILTTFKGNNYYIATVGLPRKRRDRYQFLVFQRSLKNIL